jgi:drug/metabolite transporter (DMT)-like permease
MLTQLSPYSQAAIMALIGYFLFSCADVFAKILSNRYPISICIFIPCCVAVIGVGLRILIFKGSKAFLTKNLKLHIIRALVITGLVVCCVSALQKIPLADFYAIIFLSPFVVMAVSIFIYKEPIYWPRLYVLIISFIGVIVTIGPHFLVMNLGYLFVCLAVIFGALNIIFVRKIGREEYNPLFGFFPLMFVTVTSLPFALPYLLTIEIPTYDLLLFLLYGLALMGAHSALPAAFARTPSVAKLTPLHYSQMVWGMIAGIVIFDNPLEINVIFGSILIIGSGIWLFFAERRLNLKTNHPVNILVKQSEK